MRYYIYISESKVDMLYSQIPQSLLKKIAGKLTIDLKLFKKEFSESPKDKTLHSKLQIVEQSLLAKDLIGDTSSLNSYIKGIKYMKWGRFSSGFVFFGSEDDVILGLGGSEKHIIGNVGIGEIDYSYSSVPYLIAALIEEIKGFEGVHDQNIMSPEAWALIAVEKTVVQLEWMSQKVEFLAKILLSSESDFFSRDKKRGEFEKPVILASPLYVALVE